MRKNKTMYRRVYKTHATQAISFLISSESNQIGEIHFHVVSTTQRTTNDTRFPMNRSIVLFLRAGEMG